MRQTTTSGPRAPFPGHHALIRCLHKSTARAGRSGKAPSAQCVAQSVLRRHGLLRRGLQARQRRTLQGGAGKGIFIERITFAARNRCSTIPVAFSIDEKKIEPESLSPTPSARSAFEPWLSQLLCNCLKVALSPWARWGLLRTGCHRQGVSHDLPAYEAVIFRTVASLPLLFGWLLWSGAASNPAPVRMLPLLFLRSIILCNGLFRLRAVDNSTAARHVVSIYFTMLFVAALADGHWGKETPLVCHHHRVLGNFIMVRPGSDAFQPAFNIRPLVGSLLRSADDRRHLSLRVESAVIANWQNVIYFAVA
jgi:hypothetical protein